MPGYQIFSLCALNGVWSASRGLGRAFEGYLIMPSYLLGEDGFEVVMVAEAVGVEGPGQGPPNPDIIKCIMVGGVRQWLCWLKIIVDWRGLMGWVWRYGVQGDGWSLFSFFGDPNHGFSGIVRIITLDGGIYRGLGGFETVIVVARLGIRRHRYG